MRRLSIGLVFVLIAAVVYLAVSRSAVRSNKAAALASSAQPRSHPLDSQRFAFPIGQAASTTVALPVNRADAGSVGRASPRDERKEVLAAVLDGAYATDEQPTAESLGRERAISTLFVADRLDDLGQLETVECRKSICRGVIRIKNSRADGTVFDRTFLSAEYAKQVGDAVTVSSRDTQPDGSILATFFIHPQSVFGMVAETETAGE